MGKRWGERISDLESALKRLGEAINDSKEYKLDSLKDGVIQRFEFNLELSWKSLKTYLESEGIVEITTPKQTIREGFARGIIENAEAWMEMLNDRNLTSHTYSQQTADEIYKRIVEKYYCEMEKLFDFLKQREVA